MSANHALPPVSEALATEVRRALSKEYADLARGVRTEIQDGGLFLFVEVELSRSLSANDAKSLCDNGGAILDARIPPRPDEYSWILNLTRNSEIVRSLSGGWSAFGKGA